MGVTLIFPGQGSQFVGMGKDLESFSESKSIFDRANTALGFNITDLMFQGPEKNLKQTENTQPAIVTHSIALFEKLRATLDQRNISIDQVLGHSVGEYSALVAAGVLTIEDAVKAVKKRGHFMQEAAPSGMGKMYALLRVPGSVVAEACSAVSTQENRVMPANFNEPTQTVISGHAEACAKAIKWIEDHFDGRMRAMELNVSAPFHSSLMLPAEKKLSIFLKTIHFSQNTIPYIANKDAKNYPSGTDVDLIQKNLIEQVCGSVLWSQSIQTLKPETIFIEVGPGKVLTGLNKKINKDMKTFNLNQENGFDKLLEFLDECNL
jgi:[acyl-carrier-protein] S-malonyltransferase